MKDNNVVAFYCSNCHKTVWNYGHNFEQLHEKGLCVECLKKQNKPKDKWQKLKEFIIKKQEEYQADIIEQEMQGNIPNSISFYARYNLCNEIQKKMQELEGENE